MISSATRLAVSDGIENPTPMLPAVLEPFEDDPAADAIATLIPITWPFAFTSAPPELPGLIAASVWITLRYTLDCALREPDCPLSGKLKKKSCGPRGLGLDSLGVSGAAEDATAIVRLSVETMPSVTVPLRPSGEPIAIAVSPTLSLLESPKSAGMRPLGSTLITARSDSGSVPTRLALRTEPSEVWTSRLASELAPSSVTTWVLVRMCPWLSRTTPEPVPARPPADAEMVTTDGEAFWVAAVIWLTDSVLFTITGELLPAPETPLFSASAPVPTAVPAPIRPARTIPATRAPAENLRLGVVAVAAPPAGCDAAAYPSCAPGWPPYW